MSCLTGFDGKMYYNSASYASPTWVEIKQVKDVTLTSSTDKIEDSDRGSKFKKYCTGQIDLEVSANLTYRNNDTIGDAIRNAHINRTDLDIAVMDGDITTSGTEGFRFNSKVFSHDWQQSIGDVMTVDCTFAPTYWHDGSNEVIPYWMTVS